MKAFTAAAESNKHVLSLFLHPPPSEARVQNQTPRPSLQGLWRPRERLLSRKGRVRPLASCCRRPQAFPLMLRTHSAREQHTPRKNGTGFSPGILKIIYKVHTFKTDWKSEPGFYEILPVRTLRSLVSLCSSSYPQRKWQEHPCFLHPPAFYTRTVTGNSSLPHQAKPLDVTLTSEEIRICHYL